MYNPFENEQGNYLVLVNEERQYSIWPAAITVPGGWEKEYGPELKSKCQQFIENHWLDMRPKSLSQAMDKVMSG